MTITTACIRSFSLHFGIVLGILMPVDFLFVITYKSELWFSVIFNSCYNGSLITLICFIISHISSCRSIVPNFFTCCFINFQSTWNSITNHRNWGNNLTLNTLLNLTTNTKMFLGICLFPNTIRWVEFSYKRTSIRAWFHWILIWWELIIWWSIFKIKTTITQQEEFVGGWNYLNTWFTSFIFIFCIVY